MSAPEAIFIQNQVKISRDDILNLQPVPQVTKEKASPLKQESAEKYEPKMKSITQLIADLFQTIAIVESNVSEYEILIIFFCYRLRASVYLLVHVPTLTSKCSSSIFIMET